MWWLFFPARTGPCTCGVCVCRWACVCAAVSLTVSSPFFSAPSFNTPPTVSLLSPPCVSFLIIHSCACSLLLLFTSHISVNFFLPWLAAHPSTHPAAAAACRSLFHLSFISFSLFPFLSPSSLFFGFYKPSFGDALFTPCRCVCVCVGRSGR